MSHKFAEIGKKGDAQDVRCTTTRSCQGGRSRPRLRFIGSGRAPVGSPRQWLGTGVEPTLSHGTRIAGPSLAREPSALPRTPIDLEGAICRPPRPPGQTAARLIAGEGLRHPRHPPLREPPSSPRPHGRRLAVGSRPKGLPEPLWRNPGRPSADRMRASLSLLDPSQGLEPSRSTCTEQWKNGPAAPLF